MKGKRLFDAVLLFLCLMGLLLLFHLLRRERPHEPVLAPLFEWASRQ